MILSRPFVAMIDLMSHLSDRAEQCARDVAEIAARLELTSAEIEQAEVAALLHDLGMITLPWEIRAKRAEFTPQDRRMMELHAHVGAGIVRWLSEIEPSFEAIAAAIRHHHERWDGKGYPDGLAGEEIPLAARMIAVADAYSAMTSDQGYREAMPDRVARLRLAQAVESQFDLAVVAVFEQILSARESSR
jgi:HD-GYP domain-containing protein (c-di-GMP phosphodiesterase class II)